MKLHTSSSWLARTTMLAALFTSSVTSALAYDEEELGGLQDNYTAVPDDWQEQDAVLPDYPQQANLMDLRIATDGLQYTVYLDKTSLERGSDGVVRYTVILVPPAGIWNVSNEGLRCGEKQFRRYAFGMDGEWRPLDNAPWQPIRGGGANRYRRILYEDYFCNPMQPFQTVKEMIDRFNENFHDDM